MQDSPPTGNGPTTQRDSGVVEETPLTPAPADRRQFPPTLVGMDPPTLPASDELIAHTDTRGAGDRPQFRPYPEPQRSVPGHPSLRRRLMRLLTFGRR